MVLAELPEEIEQRQGMVQRQLRGRSIEDEKVMEVMGELPRQYFIPAPSRAEAYYDQPVPIGFGQTISQPYIVALMTEKLRLRPEDVVLEVGTGCGYQTAILARLVRRVYTVELLETLSSQAQQNLRALGITNVEYKIGDGSKGWPEPLETGSTEPPRFNRILVAAGAQKLPAKLVGQLADKGRMVIPVGAGGEQKLLLIENRAGKIKEHFLCYCRFVKLVQE
jgi:protein-L-isoaspartate(D-aspartate) O-methyltransferase